jgi:hypothetical protein
MERACGTLGQRTDGSDEVRELSTAEIEEVAGGLFLELALVHYMAYNKWHSETHASCGCPKT